MTPSAAELSGLMVDESQRLPHVTVPRRSSHPTERATDPGYFLVTSRYPATHAATLESRHRACPVSSLIQRSGLRILLTLQREAGLLVDVMSSTERLK